MKISRLSKEIQRICAEPYPPSEMTYTDAFSHYGFVCPKEIKELSATFSGGFLKRDEDEHWEFYSPKDLSTAERHVPIDIRGTGYVPLIDCKDNIFVCAHPAKGVYCYLDPMGEGEMRTSESLYDLLLAIHLFQEEG